MNHEMNSPITPYNLSTSQEIPRIAHNKKTYYIIHLNRPLCKPEPFSSSFFKIFSLHYIPPCAYGY